MAARRAPPPCLPLATSRAGTPHVAEVSASPAGGRVPQLRAYARGAARNSPARFQSKEDRSAHQQAGQGEASAPNPQPRAASGRADELSRPLSAPAAYIDRKTSVRDIRASTGGVPGAGVSTARRPVPYGA